MVKRHLPGECWGRQVGAELTAALGGGQQTSPFPVTMANIFWAQHPGLGKPFIHYKWTQSLLSLA